MPAPPGLPRDRRLGRRLARWINRVDLYPRLEVAVAVLVVVLGIASYEVLTSTRAPAAGFSPSLVTALLVVNLVPLMALFVLIARRLAILLSNRRRGTAGAHLHVRLVALFATIAAVPTLLVVIFASLLFQFGTQFWFSDRAKTVLDNADQVAQAYVAENKQRVFDDIEAMAGDVNNYARDFGIDSPTFREGLVFQVKTRNLTEAAVFTAGRAGVVIYAGVNMDARPLSARIKSLDLARARAGEVRVIASAGDRVEAVVRIDPVLERYVYVSRKVDPLVLNSVARTRTALSEYKALTDRSRDLKWRFNVMLMVVSLLILAAAIWFALWLANRLASPIARLADAAERVGAGDLDARVKVRNSPDEIGTLERAFNRMTGQLKAQQNALVTANAQADERRQFTEAVLTGVSAGVLSIDAKGIIRLANHSAAELLQSTARALAGRPLAEAVPELAALLDEASAQGGAAGQVIIARGADTQTLSVRIAAESGGARSYVLTFDDISDQLADQRRAAWADVARRIAHEIKNPLTPIQLSAERLQRKYARQIIDDPETFASLTSTIVRQVGDLRRMVDEFSSFARMPKPVFQLESIAEIAKQAVFLQEVAYPNVRFGLVVPASLPDLICDRRQISQALINLLKNAAEAIAACGKTEGGLISLTVRATDTHVTIEVTDNGCGLPVEARDRLTEPYVTTRTRGTGLGLAIVKKIVEEHGGTLDLGDAPGGGAMARLGFVLGNTHLLEDDAGDHARHAGQG
ncbi:PAS domain-containing sensor histidine kinase [Sphingosinicellaceae bacterium]|nr:PAS domain-containing sensor histidine kinase [Sphingosinicellaceae bacterium]